MKLTDYLIVFMGIFLSMALVVFFGINMYTKAGTTNIQYANALTSACYDASGTIKQELNSDGVWDAVSDRERTLKTFYNTLEFCFNTEFTANADDTHRYTPVVCLIDNNGYYISYNSTFDDYGNVYINGEKAASYNTNSSDIHHKAYYESMTISPINTWTKQYGKYTVRFFLNDIIEIRDDEGNYYKDKKDDLLKILEQAAIAGNNELKTSLESIKVDADEKVYEVTTLGDLFKGNYINNDISTPMYDAEKNKVIVNCINSEVEYYINHQNIMAQNNEIPYEFTMPEIAGEDWHRLLSNPTVISFLQGRQASTGREFANVYSLAGGELIKDNSYYITTDADGVKRYHYIKADNCQYTPRIKRVTVTSDKFAGGKTESSALNYSTDVYEYYDNTTGEYIEIKNTYATMEECAELGAEPCICAVNHNHVKETE